MQTDTQQPASVNEAKGQGTLAAANGSAIEHQNRRQVWMALERIKDWTRRLENELQNNPDDVIPWIQVNSITEATSELLYSAGQVNAMICAGCVTKSPNV